MSYPVYKLLKLSIPICEIHVMVPEYTSSLAENYPWIDKVIIDPGKKATLTSQYKLLKILRLQKYDAIITLFSTTRIGILALLSGVKNRLAPATKIAQIFYNHKLKQRRSKSLKPEYEYNLDLAKHFLLSHEYNVTKEIQPPLLDFPGDDNIDTRKIFCKKYKLDIESKLIFIHPGTGGSATNLKLEQYATLVKNLKIDDRHYFVITAGPDEIEYAKQLSSLIKNTPHIVYPSTEGLVHFAKIIQLCDLFISASTGPLHLAGALNRPTAAFYQRRRSATPLRWQTLNSADRRLAFTPPDGEHESELGTIDVIAAATKINKKFLTS